MVGCINCCFNSTCTFSAHAGGGFATGNQANTYFVGLGWTGIV